ncbi:hypothetical protein [Pseudotabrizicola algicola]|uniref:Tat pathway signal sequence domain protein n=1 Tax=Pseudotabrizicola algicola TaxID=2709381 RepID=A0A6B3RQK6_9RHOB|nr:hypothetical protein [Pseudotabrizicola algicola]NEX45399.1 hypothetical protein [Pseudotabrizicola algicola]
MVIRLLAAAVAFAIAASAACAQDIEIGLNTVEPQPDACRLTFVARNDSGTDLARVVTEAVLFTKAGKVAQFTLFDFGALPGGRQRVRQFDVDGLACTDLGQVLFNGVSACEGARPETCAAALRPSSMIDEIEVTG